MIPFSGLSRFSGPFDVDGPSPLNRDITVPNLSYYHAQNQKALSKSEKTGIFIFYLYSLTEPS